MATRTNGRAMRHFSGFEKSFALKQFVYGALAGIAGALTGGLLTGIYYFESIDGYDEITSALGGILLGFPLGVSVAVYIAGVHRNKPGNFLFTVLGAFLGGGLAMIVHKLSGMMHQPEILFLFLLLLSPTLAVAGFYFNNHDADL